MACSERNRRRIDSLLLGEAGAWRELREHMRGCDACRAYYDRVVLAERLLHGGPSALSRPSAAEIERIGQALFEARPGDAALGRRILAWLAPAPRWATAVAAALALVVAIPLLLREEAPAPEIETFQARGGAATDSARVGVRAFCLAAGAVQALDPRAGEAPRCARSASLRLVLTHRAAFQRVFVVGLDDRFAPKWYAPRPPAQESVAAPPTGSADAPVGPTVRVGVNHDPGPVRIYAIFSDRPVTAAEVQAAAATLERSGARVSSSPELPLGRPDVIQRSLLIEIAP
jgi:hypothetical protein